MSNNDNIAKLLNLTPVVREVSTKKYPPPNENKLPSERLVTSDNFMTEEDLDKMENADFEEARDNIKSAMEHARRTAEELSELASSTQMPDYYKTLTPAIKELTLTSKALMEIHKQRQDIKRARTKDKKDKNPVGNEDEPKSVTNNTLIVGSTAEIQELLKKHGRNI